MFGAWHIGEVAGIRLRVHWTFLILIAWVYLSTLSAGANAAISSTLFVCAIFGCVLLHELGHALAARQYGIETRDITLLPIGGVAALERMPRNPWQELVIAIAGPLVNVVIAAAILLPMLLVPAGDFWGRSFWGIFLARLAWVNVILVVFNMIPAFPMDGGRVLRSILAMRMHYVTATHIAARVGQLTAFAMGLYAIGTGNWMLLLVAGFVFLAASSERMMVMAEQMQPFSASSAMAASDDMVFTSPVVDPRSVRAKVPAEMSAESAMRWLQWHGGEEFSVVDRGAVIGRLSKLDLVKAIANGFGSWPIARLLRVGG